MTDKIRIKQAEDEIDEWCLSNYTDPVGYISRKSLEKLHAGGSHVAVKTAIHRHPLRSGDGVPLYAGTVNSIAALKRIRDYLHQRSLARGYDGDIHGFHNGDPREAHLKVSDLEELISAVEVKEGMMDDIWNDAVERAAEIAEECVNLTPDPGAAIRVMLNARTRIKNSISYNSRNE